MLPRLLLALTALLVAAPTADAATNVSVPKAGQTAFLFAGGVKSVKVKSAPKGVTVAGGVANGRLAVAVVHPAGTKASGKVVLTVTGKPTGIQRGGKPPAGCAELPQLLAKRLKGSADMKTLGPQLAAQLCPAPPAAPAPAPAPSAPAPTGALTQPTVKPAPTATPVATATPVPGNGKKACADGIDNDGDGQTDWEDPGCSDAGDSTENSEIPVSAACAASAGVGLNGDDPAELGAGVNGDCGTFWAVEIQVAPGVASCSSNNGYECKVYDPIASAQIPEKNATDMVDVNLTLKGPVDCTKKYTMAFYRTNGEVGELQAPVANCKTLPPAAPKCSNGKDDDGDGMIDAIGVGGSSDPDPGCVDASDSSENSEVAAPASCQIVLGVWDQNLRQPGAMADGCGTLKGFWFHPAGTPNDCGYAFGDDEDTQDCTVTGLTGWRTFPSLTGLTPLKVVVPTAADADCRPMTLALLKEDGTVWFKRAKLGGC